MFLDLIAFINLFSSIIKALCNLVILLHLYVTFVVCWSLSHLMQAYKIILSSTIKTKNINGNLFLLLYQSLLQIISLGHDAQLLQCCFFFLST